VGECSRTPRVRGGNRGQEAAPTGEASNVLGVIAGAGALPAILTQEAKRAGKQVLVISIARDVDERLSSLSNSEFYQIGAGQVGKVIDTLVTKDAREAVIIGKVSRDLLFRPMRLDTRAIRMLSKLKDKPVTRHPSRVTDMFEAIAAELESAGIKLIDQRLYLGELLLQKGVVTKRKPSKTQWQDIEYGMDLARKIAELGIGQTVVVKDQMPLAVEAMEGTDEAVRRGGKLCRGGAVVAKAARPDQDFRFDVPTVGPDTIDVLVESEVAALAIEFEKAFLIEPEETIGKANEARLSVVVV